MIPHQRLHLTLPDFITNNIVHIATGYTPFYMNVGDQPLVPSIFLYNEGVLGRVEAVQIMVDRIKTSLEEAVKIMYTSY